MVEIGPFSVIFSSKMLPRGSKFAFWRLQKPCGVKFLSRLDEYMEEPVGTTQNRLQTSEMVENGSFWQFLALKCLLEAPKLVLGGSKSFVWLSPGAMNDRTTRNHFENMQLYSKFHIFFNFTIFHQNWLRNDPQNHTKCYFFVGSPLDLSWAHLN